MRRVLPAIAVALIIGAGAVLWLGGSRHSSPHEDRIRALEQAVSVEREARQLLQEELLRLTMEIERRWFDSTRPEPPPEATVAEPASESLGSATRLNDSITRTGRLIEGGFAPAQAEWIVRRESELQMEALSARYEAKVYGQPTDFFESRVVARNALRDELGDDDYERYLEANGRATRVAITSVLESSPAQTAGLRPGDEIVNYDGKRIFSMIDLTDQTNRGDPGETVVVDVIREGFLMQVAVSRGPLGITGGRSFMR